MAFTKKTVRDADVAGKRVLMRVDFNVPLKDGVVTDDTRVRAAIPTIEYLKDKGAKIILMSHLGRPKGDGPEPQFSLKPAADKLAEITGYDVKFVDDTYGEKAKAAVDALQDGEILVLENVRFDKREKKNDPEIAKILASYGDIFVLDAFGTAHRAQGSVVGPAAYLPAYAGFLLEKEVDTLTSIFAEPERPFVAIVGGSPRPPDRLRRHPHHRRRHGLHLLPRPGHVRRHVPQGGGLGRARRRDAEEGRGEGRQDPPPD